MGEHDDLVAGLETVQGDLVGLQQRLHLSRHCVQDRARRSALRNQRRHPAQRRLLLGEPPHLSARLEVRDRGGDQLGELGDARFGVGGQRLVLALGGDHGSPQSPVHHDRVADRRADAQLSHARPKGAACRRVVVDARRPPGTQDTRGDVVTVDGQARAGHN